MKLFIKILSAIISVLIIAFICLNLIQGADFYTSFFGINAHHIVIKGTYHTYEFSLIDRLPTVFALCAIFLTLFLFIFFKIDQFLQDVKSFFLLLKNFVIDTYRIIKASNVKYFLLISFFTTIYLAYCYPLTLDEPMTYNEFVKTPFWHAIFLYPYPNNHILSSLLANLTNEFKFLDLLFRLRIPAVLFSLFTWIFAYRFVRKYFLENVALFVVAVGTIIVTNMQHAYIARGYAFVMFFVVLCLYAAYNIIYQGNRRRDWFIFALSAALGAWTMPSFLYPFLSISIFIFLYNYKAIKKQILYSALVGIIVFVCYSPILIISGFEALSSNEFINTMDRISVIKALPGFILGTFVHILYMPYYVTVVLLAIPFVYSLIRRDKTAIIMWLIFGITPCLFLIGHAVIPFFRTFFYYGFILVFLTGLSFRDLLDKISSKILTIALLVVQLAGTAFFFKISRGLMPEVFQSDDVVSYILEDKKTYYVNDGISWLQFMNLEFEAERKGYSVEVTPGGGANVQELPAYDYYLIEAKYDKTPSSVKSTAMKAVFAKPINIYKREDIVASTPND